VTEALTTAAFRQALEASRRPDLRSESFSGLLYRAAATGLADRSEQSRRANPLGDLDPAHQNLSDNLALDSFLSAVDGQPLHRGLLSLPEQHRELLVMRYYDDLDNDELCAVLSCSREVLAGRLHRALRALQLALASESADVA
jgi:DNA-directed RNA polymerase specialized sigma24 family protein